MTRLRSFIFLCLLLLANSMLNMSIGQNHKVLIVQGDTINLAKDTIIRNKLVKLNLREFYHKTVGEILKNDTIKLYKKYWFSDEPPGHLKTLNLTFARGLYLEISFDKLEYQPSFSKTSNFSFDKILKEKIAGIHLEKTFFEDNVVKKYSKSK